MPRSIFTEQVIETIREIPEGRVATYGGIAALAGNPRAARHVVRILHTCSEQENLPWWRVVNREGRIALKRGYGYEEQKELLAAEGVTFSIKEHVDLGRRRWPSASDQLRPE